MYFSQANNGRYYLSPCVFGISFICMLSSSVLAEQGRFDLATQDGLAVKLGATTEIALDGNLLPPSKAKGGLFIRDVSRKDYPNMLKNPSFENGKDTYDATGDVVVDRQVVKNGKCSLKLKGGVVKTQALDVLGGGDYVVSFWAQGKGVGERDYTGNSYPSWKAYIVQVDENNRQTSPDLPLNEHTGGLFSLKPHPSDFDWALLKSSFRTSPNTKKIKMVWEGKNGELWVDDIFLAPGSSGMTHFVEGSFLQLGTKLKQDAYLEKSGLIVSALYSGDSRKIEVEVEVTDVTGKDRALEIGFRLPVKLAGWYWEEHLRKKQVIQNENSYKNWYEVGARGRWCNKLPYSCVTGGANGIALGTVLDDPRIFRISYDPDGFQICYDLGLSKDHQGNGRAKVKFVMFKYMAKWGMRSATEKYHDLYPQHFARRTDQVGMADIGSWYDKLKNPEDFGLCFGGGGGPLYDHNNQRMTFFYSEPWGWWMPVRSVDNAKQNMPETPYDQVIDQLKRYITGNNSVMYYVVPNTIPSWECASMVLNSGVYDEDGKLQMWEFENSFGSGWVYKWLFCNADPDLPKRPVRATVSLEREWGNRIDISKRLGLSTSAYVDGTGLPFDNYRKEHWKFTEYPLVFDPFSRKVCQQTLFTANKLLKRLGERIHAENKVFMNNASLETLATNAYLMDLLQLEGDCNYLRGFLGADKNDEGMNFAHCLLATKPFSFYDYDWWKVSYAPRRRAILEHCMFYGTFPGLPWVGKDGLESCEALRPVCREYIPTMLQIAKAGWKPITGAVCDDAEILLERYGCGKEGNLFITFRNPSPRSKAVVATIDLREIGLGVALKDIVVFDPVAKEKYQFSAQDSSIVLKIGMESNRTKALAIGTRQDIAKKYLEIAKDRISRLTDVGAFNSQITVPVDTVDLNTAGHVNETRSLGTYRLARDARLLDYRGRPGVVLENKQPGDFLVYQPASHADIVVNANALYAVVLRYSNESSGVHALPSEGASVRVGFLDYDWSELSWQELPPMKVLPNRNEGIYEATFTVPNRGHFVYFSIELKGNNTKLYLSDQLFVSNVKIIQPTLAKLTTGRQRDPWLATAVPAARARWETSFHQLEQAHPLQVKQLENIERDIKIVSNELRGRFPQNDELRNVEAWQRISDALENIKFARQAIEK